MGGSEGSTALRSVHDYMFIRILRHKFELGLGLQRGNKLLRTDHLLIEAGFHPRPHRYAHIELRFNTQ